MLKIIIMTATAGLIFGLCATSANAQSSDVHLNNSDIELRAGITIPFGGSGQSKKDKPQFQLSMRNYKYSVESSYNWALYRAGTDQYYESKFAITLEDQPAFLINNQQLILNEEQMNLTTTQTILIGGAVVIGLMAISYIDDCKDDPFC